MKEHEMRFRVPQVLFKKYKILCTKKDLSITKQTAALIKNFVDIQEDNDAKIADAISKNKG